MDIAILAPSPVRFAMGGAEHLWLGLQRHLNEDTAHNCEVFKFPSPGDDLGEILASYLEPQRFDLDHFDVLLTGKDPAWFVEHADHRIYMLHKLRGLYDTYHFFREPEIEDQANPVARKALADLDRLIRQGAGPSKARKVVEALLTEIGRNGIDDHTLRFPGPFTRQVVHSLDQIALNPERIALYAAISRTVAKRADYFPPRAKVAIAHPPPRLSGFQCKRPEHFFTVSRLDSAKRIDLIIREYAKVPGDVPLLIGGVGPALEDLRAAAAGDDRIVFLGKLTDVETLDHYGRSIAVPFTPYDEDYGLITVEAMKSGKPVMTVADTGGVTELVRDGENGWCVPNEEGALAKAFEDSISDMTRTAEMGRAAERSVRDITWENVAEVLLGDRKAKKVYLGGKFSKRTAAAKGKIVVVSTFGIYPPRGGGQSRIFHLYSKIAEKYDVVAVCLVGGQEEFSDREIAKGFREIRIPKTDAHEQEETKKSGDVEWVPITDIVCSDLIQLTPRFEEVLSELAKDADAVVASGPYLIDAIARAMPKTPLLYEAHNLEVELKRDIIPDTSAGRKLIDTTARVEKSCWTDSKLVFACAARDLASLSREYGASSARQIEVPNGFSVSETTYTSPADRASLSSALHPSMQKSALFLGSWHGPNLTAVGTIIGIAPLFDDVRFLLVGSACLAFKGRDLPANVMMLGVVDEEEKDLLLASGSVAINPMSEGSGSNLKMLDYFGSGIPVISTMFGARGIEAEPGVHFIPAEIEELPRALSEFFSVRSGHDEMISRAHELAVSRYSWDVIGSEFLGEMEALLTPSQKVRKKS